MYNPLGLSKREVEICKLINEGNSNGAIASILDIKIRTIETHRNSINRKLRVKHVVDIINYTRDYLLEDTNG